MRLITTTLGEDDASRPQSRNVRRNIRLAVVGYYSPKLQRILNIMATERDTTLQAILGQAIDLWLREQGKDPFGER